MNMWYMRVFVFTVGCHIQAMGVDAVLESLQAFVDIECPPLVGSHVENVVANNLHFRCCLPQPLLMLFQIPSTWILGIIL